MFILKMALPRLVEVKQVQIEPKPKNLEETRQEMLAIFGTGYQQKMREGWADRGIHVN
jgi:hypothetical protein